MTIRLVDAAAIDAAFDFPRLIATLRTAFATPAVVPPRHHHAIAPTATHLLMPAWSASAPGRDTFLGTKIVSVFTGNGARGLPAVSGLYVLQSGETGAVFAAIDGARLTLWRTAAVSALAASFLARPDSTHLLMVGAGALAPFLIRAHAAVRPITTVTLWNHRRARAETLAASLSMPGVSIAVADDLGAAVAQADIIACATLTATPLIEGRWLRAGQHLDLVGAFTLAMREADDAALQRSRLFVDTDAARHEGGDVAVALRAGALQSSDIVGDLHDLCTGAVPGRPAADVITAFKSIGTAAADLAAASLVWTRLREGA